MAVAEIVTALAANPYFRYLGDPAPAPSFPPLSAGFGLFGVGSLAAVGRAGVVLGAAAFRRHWVTSMQVTATAPAS